MALSASALADLIEGKFPELAEQAAKDARKAVLTAIAEAVVEHINSAAEINGVVAVGLTSATGGPVTGSAILPPGSVK